MTCLSITFSSTVTIMERSRDPRIQWLLSAHVLASGLLKFLFYCNCLCHFLKKIIHTILANNFFLFVFFLKKDNVDL